MRKKGIFIRMVILIILLFGMAACSSREFEKQEEFGLQEEVEEQETNAAGMTDPAVREITIDFPFNETDSYLLTLARLEKPDGEYELRLYDENGKILQQISCGALTEPIQFSYDILYGGIRRDLEIFSADSDTGLFFEFSAPDDRFSENAIQIPKYAEKRGRAMLTAEDEQTYQIQRIYQLDEQLGYVYEVRCWKLQRDTGELEIWDNLENQSLFEGIVVLDEEGNPANKEYYDMLFWDDRYWLRNYEEETSVQTWIDGPREEKTEESQGIKGFEKVQKEVFGNNGHTEEYESRESLLADFGFPDSDPVYEYYDRYHNIHLELYKDKSSEQFCGIVYDYYFNNKNEKQVKMYGFTISTVQEQEWVEKDIFSTKIVDGSNAVNYVYDPEEIMEYTPYGRMDHYCCRGLAEREEDGELADRLCTAVEINYIYLDDGTLFCRDYRHDSYLIGSTLCTLKSFYDESERIIFESGYITHGELQYFYIYEDEEKMPTYCLCIDYNAGYAIPTMIRYF